MPPIPDHPLRYAMANELHARPFPKLNAPARAAYLAIKPATGGAGRDRDADLAHLIDLLDRYGAAHPPPDATHYSGVIGKHMLKWESHTEFVTYTIFGAGVAQVPFDAGTFGMFPEDWLAAAPGVRVTSALIRIEELDGDAGIIEKSNAWFVPESLAISRVLDNELIIASDFRIDTSGHMRIAVFARPNTGAAARKLSPVMSTIDGQVASLIADLNSAEVRADQTLKQLLTISAELENIVAQTAYRFGATGAYETIVNQRIMILREERFLGRQTFAEFMMRRFDPAMRTVESTQTRLRGLSDRALRAGDLLRTRVDVERSAQNQQLLSSMDQRADQQLRLQQTVEGLSVVAISYYAVGLALYLLGPLEKTTGLAKTYIAAGITPIVLVGVWLMIRRIHRKMH